MLYRINLPTCTQHLEWIVRFQSDLLRALCEPNINAAAVTVDWVKNRRSDIDVSWIVRFCRWTKNGKPMLERMKAIANLSRTAKTNIMRHYNKNLRYFEAFDDILTNPPATKPLPNTMSKKAVLTYCDFFEMFYSPIIYKRKGYPINTPDLNGRPFTKDIYLEAYNADNPNLEVCPLCDGSMDGRELDHWLPQTEYFPELNCHPQNLVEICKNCNGVTNKGNTLALDENEEQPFLKWFHPHLRPAVDNFYIEKQDSRLKLISDDTITQERLDNLDSLLKLSARWLREWRIQEKIIKRHVRRYVNEQKLDNDAIRTEVEALKRHTEIEIGLTPHTLVRNRFLTAVLDQNSNEHAEIHIYAEECRQKLSG